MDIIEEIREEGRREGLKEVRLIQKKARIPGLTEGQREGRKKVILNMLEKKLDISLISELTDFPVKEIKKLENGIKSDQYFIKKDISSKETYMKIKKYLEKGRIEGDTASSSLSLSPKRTIKPENRKKALIELRKKMRQQRILMKEEAHIIWLIEGHIKVREKIILNMLKKKLNIFLISEVTDLPVKDIKMLKNWKELEQYCINEGFFSKGIYINTRENIKEEGRIEGQIEGFKEGRMAGRKERNQELILNMLKKKMDVAFIFKVMGLPVKKIEKFKNSS